MLKSHDGVRETHNEWNISVYFFLWVRLYFLRLAFAHQGRNSQMKTLNVPSHDKKVVFLTNKACLTSRLKKGASFTDLFHD